MTSDVKPSVNQAPKIDLAQINPRVGDIEGNLLKLLEATEIARTRRAALLVFPELALSGYPPRDLVFSSAHLRMQSQAIERLATAAGDLTIVAGCITRSSASDSWGRPFHNSAVVLQPGNQPTYYHKRLLPTYDVFDEDRYFEPGTVPMIITIQGMHFGVSICEDIWDPEGHRYRQHPLEDYRDKNLTALINLSSSPFHLGRPHERTALLKTVAKRIGCPVIYCNQVGGNEELIFDGCSQAVDPNGNFFFQAPAFAESYASDVLSPPKGQYPFAGPQSRVEWTEAALELGLRDFVHKCGMKSVLIGLSGGIDSSVVAALAVKALGAKNVVGVLLPSRFTSAASLEDSRFIATALGIKTYEISIETALATIRSQVTSAIGSTPSGTVDENIQPRVRMLFLMALSNQWSSLLLNTSNKSEIATGYSTQYGDTAGAIGVIGDLVKGDVYALGHRLNLWKHCIPSRVFDRAPTAELKLNQTDQDQLPPYPVLDSLVKQVVEDGVSFDELKGFDPRWVDCFQNLYRTSEFKRRQFPPILRVTHKAFGLGRRIPIAAQIV